MLAQGTSSRAGGHQVLWFRFIKGRTVVTGALLLVLLAVQGIVPPPPAVPLHLLAFAQFGVNGIYLYLWRKRELAFLGYLVFSIEILLISTLIFTLGGEGDHFLLAYLWPIMMGGWLIGSQAVLPLALLAAVAYATLIGLDLRGIQPLYPAWPPEQGPLGALLGLVYLISVAVVVWVCYMETSRQRSLLHRRNLALLRTNADLRGLLRASEELGRPDGEQELLATGLAQLSSLLGQVAAGIYLRDGDGWVLRAERDLDQGDRALVAPKLAAVQHWGLWERFLTGDGKAVRGVAASGGRRDLYLVPLSSPHAIEGCLAIVLPSEQGITPRQRHMTAFLARSLGSSLEGRRLLADLRRERDLTLNVLNNLNEGVFVADRAGTITLANPAAEELIEVRPGQRLPDQLRAIVAAAGHGGEPTPWKGRYLAIRRALLGDAQDAGAGVIYVARDVTTDLAAQQRQSDFVAFVAHELRTPLTTMRTLTSLLANEDTPAVKRAEYLGVIASQIERQTKLVRALLDLSRLEAGHYELPMDLIDVRDVVREAVAVCQPLALAKELEIQVSLPSSEILAQTSADGLQQVLINLLSNAVKFTDPGGELGIACAVAAGHCRMRVWDRGIGMTTQEQQMLFVKYASHSSQDGREGIGLGLVISKLILDQLGADIQVRSQPGEGSVFTISLPLKTIDSSTPPAATPSPGKDDPAS